MNTYTIEFYPYGKDVGERYDIEIHADSCYISKQIYDKNKVYLIKSEILIDGKSKIVLDYEYVEVIQTY